MSDTSARYPIRTATPESVRAFNVPLLAAFGEELTEAWYDDWRRTIEPDRLIAAFDGEVPVATAAAYSFRITVPGGVVPAAGVTAVGVEPGHRRRGILRSLMRQQLDDVRERGEPVAVLWASEAAIYQRFGYGLGALNGRFEIERGRVAWLRPGEPSGRMRMVDEVEALAAFPGIYDRVREATPGALTRTEDWWRWGVLRDAEHQRRGAGPMFRYLHEVGGAAEGYAIYRVKADWDEGGPRNQVQVVEAMAATPRAERAVWGFLFDIDLTRSIRARRISPAHPLLLALADPRALGITSGDGLWVRLVDLPAALTARRYGIAGEVVLEVTDAFCPWNAGRWRLATTNTSGAEESIGAMAGAVERTDARADIIVDTTDLAAAYLGAFRFSDLARAGRVEERTPGALRRADAMFASDRPPWCATMF
jgi:predicted acetyltransferase